MKEEIKITKLIFVFVLLLIITTAGLRFVTINKIMVSPLSKSFSIYAFLANHKPPSKTVYGFLPWWSLKDAKYLQLDKLTDIAYFGLNIDAEGNFVTHTDEGSIDPGYDKWINDDSLVTLIKNAKLCGVKIALTIISHYDETSDRFLNCQTCWDNLANNTIAELRKKEITDVNINFEYTEYTPKETADKYTRFIKYLNDRLDNEFVKSEVIVSTFADSMTKPRVTDIKGLGQVADGIFIMAYDFHRPTSKNAGPVAPINGKGVHAEYDISTMLLDYVSVSPPNKLIMGVPYYGYNWVVETDEKYAQRISGNDDIGYSQSQTYKNIMDTILETSPDIEWDELAQSPYFIYTSPKTNSIREVYFDNKDSLREKYKLVKKNGLRGVGIWALGYDGGYTDLWDLLGEEFTNKEDSPL